MAIPINSDDIGQDNTNQPGSQNQGQNGSSGQAGGQAPTQTPNPNQQKGSGYTNIQKVIQANQGNRLGQTIGGGIQQAGQQTQQALGQAQNQFQQQTGQNQFDTDSNKQLVGNVLNNPDQYVPSAQNNLNAQQGSQFQRLISGQYAGPQGLQNSDQLQAQAQSVNQMGKALGSQGGRTGLLQRFVGNPQYQQGQQTLDSLLLGQTGGQDLAAARRSIAGVGGQIQSGIAGAQAQAQEQSNKAQQFGQDVQNQFGVKVNDINTNLTNQAQTAQQARDAQYKQMLMNLQSGNVNQNEADQLGLTQGQTVTGDTLKNMGQFFSENPEQANAQNIASGQDYARLQALQKLSGGFGGTNVQSTLGQFNDPTKANAFQNAQAVTGDKEGFQKANNAQLADYNGQLGTLQNQANDPSNFSNIASLYTGPKFDLSTPENIQNQIDYLKGVHGQTWMGSSEGAGAQANQALASKLQGILNQMNGLQTQFGNKNIAIQGAPTDQATLRPVT